MSLAGEHIITPPPPPPLSVDEVFSDFKTRAEMPSEGMEEDYRVRLPAFEGPLDLLLHLIRRDQLNVYDIPVSQICQNYLEYLSLLCHPDVNLAGEFFVMAATLLHLKSQMLLPQEEIAPEEDPRLPLVAQLLELERFRRAATQIDTMPWLERDLYLHPVSQNDVPVEALLEAPLEPVETFNLLVCLKSALDRTERPPLQISVDTTSIREKVTSIGSYLEERGLVEFASFIPPGTKRFEIVVSFLAILELARLKCIEIIQTETFGPIQLRQVKSVKDLNMNLLQQF